MRLKAYQKYRLYDLSVNQNEDGFYELIPFSDDDDDDTCNEGIAAGEIGESLKDLAKAVYGYGSHWYEITDDLHYDGKIIIEINDDDRLEINDIRRKISTNVEGTCFYILVDGLRSNYQWVGAEPTVRVISG